MATYLTHTELNQVIQTLLPHYNILAPGYENKGGRFAGTDNLTYLSVTQASDIVWQEKSHFSPKEAVTPITQTLFHFNGDELRESKIEARPTLIFLRACDINALKRLDHMYLNNGNNEDIYYCRLRQQLKLVLIECAQSFENCFCVSMNSNTTDNYDAAVRFDANGVAFMAKDPELQSYLNNTGKEIEFTPQFVQSNPTKVRTPDQVCNDPNLIRQILHKHPVWSEYDSRCIGCGRCTTSCPTCSCYNMFDVAYDENHKVGERRRQQASCMTNGFADMAGGHSFRDKTGERLRYRALHKVNDYKARQGHDHMCVGCGRCDDRCPHYISFTNIINRMTDIVEQHLNDEVEHAFSTHQKIEVTHV